MSKARSTIQSFVHLLQLWDAVRTKAAPAAIVLNQVDLADHPAQLLHSTRLIHGAVDVRGRNAVGAQQLRQQLHVVPCAGEDDGRLARGDDLRDDVQQRRQLVLLPAPCRARV